jgi:hypothetical protein
MIDPSQQPEPDNSDKSTEVRKRTGIVFPMFRVIVVVLLVLNLSATSALLVDHFTSSEFDSSQYMADGNQAPSDTTAPLPESLRSEAARMTLFYSMVDLYNDRDYDGLYDMCGPILKTEMSHQQFKDQLEALYHITDTIENGVYSHYRAVPKAYGMTEYRLFYLADTDAGPTEVHIILYQQHDDPYQITGFYLHI